MTDEILRLCDAAAESLILCDVDDADSIAELIASLAAIASAFGDVDDSHPACVALALAEGIQPGDAGALGRVEKAFADTRRLAEQVLRKDAPPARRAATAPAAAARTGRATAAARATTASADPTRAAATGTMPLSGDAELMSDFVVRACEHLDDADALLLDLEQSPADRETIDAVFRAFHTIKGMAGFLALDAISERSHYYESLLSVARNEDTAVEDGVVEALFAGVDEMRRLIAEATGAEPDITSAAETEDVACESAAAGNGNANGGHSAREGTVRVAEARLDVLLDTIGELVIAESMTSAFVREGSDMTMMLSQLERLDKITRELQHMATSLRMVPLKATFGRMARLVRDLSHKSGKPVEFFTSGEDTELDKAVVDRIQDPLIHALRNAVDHGIEAPKLRKAAGKPIEGRVELRAFHAGGSIHIEVIDDGAGIDAQAVMEKARAKGLIGPDEVPTREQVLELLFMPGFSTATQVTDVSGRGVGMDVVRRTVEDLRGRIDVRSEPGEGTATEIRLPMTLAIIDGMVCRVGDERYIVPVLAIERSVRPHAGEISSVIGRGLMLDTGDGMLPIVRLHELLGVPGAQPDPTEAVVIIVSEGGQRAGLLVCELLGQQQTVIKPLGDGLPDQPGIAGGAIMPDGRVGLILDAAGLVRLAHRKVG